MKICSFDIFDTCLVRACGNPDNIFSIVAKKVIKGASRAQIADFCMMRLTGESAARRRNPLKEITIEEIYDNCDFSSFTDLSKDELMAVEMDTERENLVSVCAIHELINRKREEGYVIIYISDMYLPQSFIEEILIKEGFLIETNSIFVSSLSGKTKASGELYENIRLHYSENITEWIHYGDNKNSDYNIPLKHKITPSIVDHTLTLTEKHIYDNPTIFNNEFPRLIASISKAARLHSSNSSCHEIAADYIAPLFVPFVYWVLELSRKRNISDLYFVARDGCILHNIAQSLSPLFKEIRISYIYISRSSLYFPTCENFDEIKTLLMSDHSKTNDPYEVIENYTGLTSSDFSNPPEMTLEEILDDASSKKIILKKYLQSRELLVEYFKQEGVADRSNSKSAIVDLRGTGKSLILINELLSAYKYHPIEGFYFELTSRRNFKSQKYYHHAIIFQEELKGSDRIISQAYALLESYFAAANHPRTLGYRYNEYYKIVPIFENDQYLDFNRSLYNIHKSIIKSWATMYVSTFAYTENLKSLEIGLTLLKYFFTNPRDKYLKVLSGLVISSTGIEHENYIRKLKIREVWTMCSLSGSFIWFDGSFIYTFGKYSKYVKYMINILNKIRLVKRKLSDYFHLCFFRKDVGK